MACRYSSEARAASRNQQWLARMFPADVAIGQAAYERHLQILRAHQAGAKQSDIARKLNISRNRVYQIIRRAESYARRTPPVARYFRSGWNDYKKFFTSVKDKR